MANPLDLDTPLRLYQGSPPSTPGASPDPRALLAMCKASANLIDSKAFVSTGTIPRKLLVLAPKSLSLCAILEIVYSARHFRLLRIATGDAIRLRLVTGTKVLRADVHPGCVYLSDPSPDGKTWGLATPGTQLLINVPTVDDGFLSLSLRLRGIQTAVADPPLDIF